MADFVLEGRRVEAAFLQIVESDEKEWTLCKNKQDKDLAVAVHRRPSSASGADIFRSEVLLQSSPEQVMALVSPVLPYRPQWDEFIDRIELVNTLAPNMYLIYHLTKPAMKGLISARDSIDVVVLGETEHYGYVAAGGVDHPDYPPSLGNSCVRTFQYPAGYAIKRIPDEPDKCIFRMFMHMDLNMNSVANFMANMVKPKLMIQKVQNLKKAIDTLKVDESHLGGFQNANADGSL